MENPASWKSAELVIHDALEDWESHRGRVIGGSRVIAVANALRASGHLNDADEESLGWDRLRAHWDERRTSEPHHQDT